ncbi:linear amide C-N hydrolase [Streptosporangium lutulentum]
MLAPFDGMNDQGLAIGLAAAPDARLPAARPGNATVGGLRIIRLVLDRAASVPEAIELMRRYDIDFTGGPQLHYLIADRAGRSAVVEYGEGRVNVLDERYLTNIALTGADRATKLADRRYRLLAEGGRTEAMELLRKVAQPHTRWSVVYDLDSRHRPSGHRPALGPRPRDRPRPGAPGVVTALRGVPAIGRG